MMDDNISVSLRTKTDTFTFISQFRSVMERESDDEATLNPFDSLYTKNLDRVKTFNKQMSYNS